MQLCINSKLKQKTEGFYLKCDQILRQFFYFISFTSSSSYLPFPQSHFLSFFSPLSSLFCLHLSLISLSSSLLISLSCFIQVDRGVPFPAPAAGGGGHLGMGQCDFAVGFTATTCSALFHDPSVKTRHMPRCVPDSSLSRQEGRHINF